MNHLAGLPHAAFDTSTLTPKEVEALTAFRIAHESWRPRAAPASSSSSSSLSLPLSSSTSEHPAFLISSPPSTTTTTNNNNTKNKNNNNNGWRPLDDWTLYRFLCADRRHGEFFPQKSLQRLKDALAFRQRCGADDILRQIIIKDDDENYNNNNNNNSNNNNMMQEESTVGTRSLAGMTHCLEQKNDNDNDTATSSSSAAAPAPMPKIRRLKSLATGVLQESQEVGQNEHIVILDEPLVVDQSNSHRNNDNNNNSNSDDERGDVSKQHARDRRNTNTATTATATSTGTETKSTKNNKNNSIPSSSSSTSPPLPPLSLLQEEDLAKYQRLRIRIFVGRDRHGRPVMFERLGEFMGSDNVRHFTIPEWNRFYIWDLERHFTEMRRASVATRTPVTKYIYLGDVEGIIGSILNRSIWHTIPVLKALVKDVENHYPEIVETIVLFNMPRVAAVVYSAVKRFLDPVTAAKIELHAGVPHGRIKELMDESVIPVAYGGSNPVHYPKTAKS